MRAADSAGARTRAARSRRSRSPAPHPPANSDAMCSRRHRRRTRHRSQSCTCSRTRMGAAAAVKAEAGSDPQRCGPHSRRSRWQMRRFGSLTLARRHRTRRRWRRCSCCDSPREAAAAVVAAAEADFLPEARSLCNPCQIRTPRRRFPNLRRHTIRRRPSLCRHCLCTSRSTSPEEAGWASVRMEAAGSGSRRRSTSRGIVRT